MIPIRTFLAIPLPKELTGYLKQWILPIVDRNDHINWVKRENIHITLSFLGDTDPEKIEDHGEKIASVVHSFQGFELGTTDTGIFPHANAPRVIWVGTAPYGPRLGDFKKVLDKALVDLGYALEKRPFQPHITLARVKTISRKSSFIHEFLSAEVREMNFEVNEIKWLKSTLTPVGAEYEELKTFKFNAGGQ